MPWKNKEAQKAYARKQYLKENGDPKRKAQRKLALKRFREKHRLQLNKIKRDNYDPVKDKIRRDRRKEKQNAHMRKESEDLTEKYMIRQLKKEGYTIEMLKLNPEIITTKRLILKTKRLCKTSKNYATA